MWDYLKVPVLSGLAIDTRDIPWKVERVPIVLAVPDAETAAVPEAWGAEVHVKYKQPVLPLPPVPPVLSATPVIAKESDAGDDTADYAGNGTGATSGAAATGVFQPPSPPHTDTFQVNDGPLRRDIATGVDTVEDAHVPPGDNYNGPAVHALFNQRPLNTPPCPANQLCE